MVVLFFRVLELVVVLVGVPSKLPHYSRFKPGLLGVVMCCLRRGLGCLLALINPFSKTGFAFFKHLPVYYLVEVPAECLETVGVAGRNVA